MCEKVILASRSFDYKIERVYLMLDVLMLKIKWFEIKEEEIKQ